MPIKFKRRKKIKQEDLETAVIHFFVENDRYCQCLNNHKVKNGITRPDIAINSRNKNFLIELKTHSPMLSDISMVKQASIEFFNEENKNYVPVIIYPSEETRSDVSQFADETGVKLVSLDNIEELDEKMNYYLY